MLSVECVPRKNSELIYSASTVLFNKSIFFFIVTMLFSVKVFSFALYELNVSTSQMAQGSILIAHAMVLHTSVLWKGVRVFQMSASFCSY